MYVESARVYLMTPPTALLLRWNVHAHLQAIAIRQCQIDEPTTGGPQIREKIFVACSMLDGVVGDDDSTVAKLGLYEL